MRRNAGFEASFLIDAIRPAKQVQILTYSALMNRFEEIEPFGKRLPHKGFGMKGRAEVSARILPPSNDGLARVEIVQFFGVETSFIGVAMERQDQKSIRPQYSPQFITPCDLCFHIDVGEN